MCVYCFLLQVICPGRNMNNLTKNEQKVVRQGRQRGQKPITIDQHLETIQTLTCTSLQDSAIMAACTLLSANPSISFFRWTGAWPT